MRCFRLLAIFPLCLGIGGPAPPLRGAQQSIEVQTLFRQLESTETTDSATEKLLKLSESDPRARQYLAGKLPSMIERGPADSHPWNNAVQLAGHLKIAEAAPALVRWIGKGARGTFTLTDTIRLRDNPTAKALVEIGDPSLPRLAPVLQRGNLAERWDAALVLYNIDTQGAKEILRNHLERETDESLRSFIKNSLD